MERGTGFVSLDCSRCGLCQGRTQVVPAEGPPLARAFFVGEAPGPEEDRIGRPFVGRAGKILRASLLRAGWKDDEVWITNVVKCFPHVAENGRRKIRAPAPDEVEACRPHLEAEVRRIRPQILVALGRTAAVALTGRALQLSKERGRLLEARPGLDGAKVFVTFHPSGLHYAKGRTKEFEQDLSAARRLLSGPVRPP